MLMQVPQLYFEVKDLVLEGDPRQLDNMHAPAVGVDKRF
jgi:hypothetical protein